MNGLGPSRWWMAAGATLGVALAGACAPPSTPGPQVHRVEIVGLEYRPATLTVAAGDTVIWLNRGIVPHTVTVADAAGGEDVVSPGEEISIAVAEAGTVAYLCRFHPTMTGTLTVR